MNSESGNLLSRSIKFSIRGLIAIPLLGSVTCWLVRKVVRIVFLLKKHPNRMFCYQWAGFIREFPEIFQGVPVHHWVTRFASDFSMALGLTDAIEIHLLENGEWDQHVADYITHNLTPGDIFVDIGAHIGYQTLTAAGAVGPQGQVFSFEPNPETHQRLLANIELNSFRNIHASNMGLGAVSGMHTFYLGPPTDSGASSFHDAGKTPNSAQVMMGTFDEVITDHDIYPVLVKIDVEGFELEVLNGMSKILSRDDVAVICELSGSAVAEQADNPRRVVSHMAELGYSASILDSDEHGKLIPVDSRSKALDIEFHIDVVFRNESKQVQIPEQ